MSDAAAHLRERLHQVLFTVPGERVNRPDFGCGLLAYPFEPNDPQTGAMLEVLIRANLERCLGRFLDVRDVGIEGVESSLTITVQFTTRDDEQPRNLQFRVERT